MNEITLPVSELKTALHGLGKIVSRKTSLPVLQNVKVSRQRNGQVTLQATDLDAFATYTLTGTQSGPATEVLMPFEQLNKAFKCSGPKDEVALICDGKEAKLRYTIAGSPVYQPVTLTKVDEWPPLPEIKVNSFKLDAEFGPALKQALESCSDDPSRYVLRGACLDVTDTKCHYVVGTNGRALFSANSFTFPIKKSVIIPDSKFLAAGDLLDEEPCYLSVQPGKDKHSTSQVCLHNARWQFITREIDGKYPNWRQVVPITNGRWTLVKLNPSAVSQLLQVIPRLPGNDGINCPVRLRIEKCLWAEGRDENDKEWTKIAVSDVVVTGKPQTIQLNRNYLLQALKFGLDEFAVEDELSPLVFNKAGKKFIIMPVNPHSPAATQTPSSQPAATRPAATPQTSPTTTKAPVSNPAPTEERKTEMPKATTKTEPSQPTETSTTVSLIDQVERVKETLKNVIRDLIAVIDAVKLAEKEKRASEKEVEAARATLKKLQQVSL